MKKLMKNKPLLYAVIVLLLVCVFGMVLFLYIKYAGGNDSASGDASGNAGFGRFVVSDNNGSVSASGTTSIGMDDKILDLDFLTSKITVEEVYVQSGDEVEAGQRICKLDEESVAEVREELEETLEEAYLAYRSGKISYKQSLISASYDYQISLVEAKYKDSTYDSSVASANESLASVNETMESLEEQLAEVQASLDNNLADEYPVDDLYSEYKQDQQILDYYSSLWNIPYWLYVAESSSSTAQSIKISVMDYNSRKMELQQQKQAANVAGDTEAEAAVDASIATLEYNYKNQDDRWGCYQRLHALYEETQSVYKEWETAAKTYNYALTEAKSKLEAIKAKISKQNVTVLKTQKSTEESILSAENTRDSVSETQIKEDYDTTLDKAEDTFNDLEDAYEKAKKNLEEFEAELGDGYIYTEKAGNLVMVAVSANGTVTGDSMLIAFSNPTNVTVSASVSQNDIAKLTVGDKATVRINNYGTYEGTITSINPVSSSTGKTSVAYTVTITIATDSIESAESLSSNLSATVVFETGGAE